MNQKKLYKVPDNRKISGVCQGFSEYFNVDVTLIRILWVVLTLFACGTGIILYIICALIMPNKDDIKYNDF